MAFAQPKKSKIPLRKALFKTVTRSKTRQHSRRSAADCCSLTRGPPHSTSPLALANLQKVAQNHGGFCQNLGRPLASSDRTFATKCSCVCEFQCQEILQKSLTNGSESIKIHQNEPKWRPSKKNSPQDRKRAKKGAKGKNFLTPLGTQNQQKSKEKGSRKSMTFSTSSWNRLCLILGSPRHPKSRQNEVKIGPRTARTHFCPDCIFCRPCQ